jgi:hypothetical protein
MRRKIKKKQSDVNYGSEGEIHGKPDRQIIEAGSFPERSDPAFTVFLLCFLLKIRNPEVLLLGGPGYGPNLQSLHQV